VPDPLATLVGVEDSFGTVLIAIAVVAAVVACISYIGSGAIYRGLGRTGLALDEPDPRPAPRPDAGDPALREEVREVVIAGNERRARRGQPPLDVEREIDRRLRDLGA
jgi:hypothetical protein